MYQIIQQSIISFRNLAIATALLATLPACESEETISGNIHQQVCLTATMEEEAITRATAYPDKGTYYLSFRENTNEGEKDMINSLYIGNNGAISKDQDSAPESSGSTYKLPFYWINIIQGNGSKAQFTLSNVPKEGAMPEDILWDNDSKWLQTLNFSLTHRMAQVVLKLTIEGINESDITSVTLVHAQKEYTFDRSTGAVTGSGNAGITLSKKDDQSGSIIYSAILPPQDRKNKEKILQIKIETNDKTYLGNLPYGMSQLIPGKPDEREDVPLSFKAGHILELEASIKMTPDYTVQFTYATLKDWVYKGEYHVAAKPAGLYLTSELKACISEYNSSSAQTNLKLLKYGTNDGSGWKFTLRRNIDAASVTEKFSVTKPTITQESSGTYKITGKTADELNVTNNNECFESPQP